ncbi:MAG: elongation factor P [Minisyncoccia bacterium]
MLTYNEAVAGVVVVHDEQPCVVLTSWVFRKQMGKPVNQVKMRNLRTGAVIEHTYHQPDKVEEAELETQDAKYIYSRNGEWWFSEPKNPANRYALSNNIVGDQGRFLMPNMEVEVVLYEGEIISMKMPIKVDLKVTEAPPSIKGNTAQGGNKNVVVETGATVSTPLFVDMGDVIRVNTQNGEYVERVSKSK